MQNQNNGIASRKWRISSFRTLVLVLGFALSLGLAACGSDENEAGDPSDSSSVESKKPSEGAESPEAALEQVLDIFESENKELFIAYLVDSELRKAARQSKSKHFIDKFVEETASAVKWDGRTKRPGEEVLGITPTQAKEMGVRQFWIQVLSKVLFVKQPPKGVTMHDLVWMNSVSHMHKLVKKGKLPGAREAKIYRANYEKHKSEDRGRAIEVRGDKARINIGPINALLRKQDGKWYVEGIVELAYDMVILADAKY